MITASLRKSYGEALVQIGRENKDIVVLEADLGKSTMSCFFEDQFPDRYFQMGIAEQNMASTSAGLALAGKIPFYSTFAVFATGRAYDQIRSSIAIPDLNVNICGSSAGLSDFGDGKTHQSIDDIALMRVLPNMTVLSPVDAEETKKMVKAMAESEGPAYIRINRSDLPVLTADDDKPYQIGQMTSVKKGDDITVFASGIMVHQSLKAAEMLEKEGISVEVVNVSCIKPLDKDAVKQFSAGRKGIVTAEEHSIIGGMGSAITEAMSENPLPLVQIGVQDKYGTSASCYEDLLKAYGLTEDDIVTAVKRLIKK
ncbi:transketolase C-terminal domain-containing protein [Oceanispirochaeta sp.]|jgi:transketolase|uniref:transketolase family protein n=1 Tax=Oceanispirochaeta sp. TaxID=2035350 RepID=UPI00260F985E|nr:transketolase C-terminal domain-containing protein [Oceanispirochaeta sp.]MDA3955586.1 transketolase family protein [Oceanispirochaeta sp.]